MIYAFDVQYINDSATVACVAFNNWSDCAPDSEYILKVDAVQPYESGNFYKRELPCIIALIEQFNLCPKIIIVDGYVWLDEAKIGLGGHLYNQLSEKIPVIGVAKTKFKSHSKLCKLLRGNSQNPIYISSIGIGLAEATKCINMLDGKFRLPTLLKRVDLLCRELVLPVYNDRSNK